MRYTHIPYRRPIYRHSRRYYKPFNYHWYLRPAQVWRGRWVRYHYTYNNGYYVYNNYPYYVYNNYLHRYSDVDTCDYSLVDSKTGYEVNKFFGYTCNYGYDKCSLERDRMNTDYGEYRYFCAEGYVRDPSLNYDWDVNYDNNHYDPNYSDDQYNDNGYDNNGYDDNGYDDNSDPYYDDDDYDDWD